MHLVYFVISSLLLAGCIEEYLRFQDALNIATQEHFSYQLALNNTACAKDETVVSIEWKGSVLDCQLARLVLQRSPLRSAYILWWNQSAWVSLWKLIAHNTLVVTVICVVIITSFMGFGMHAISSMHLHKQMANTITQMNRQRDKMLALPPPSVQRTQWTRAAPKRVIFDEDD